MTEDITGFAALLRKGDLGEGARRRVQGLGALESFERFRIAPLLAKGDSARDQPVVVAR